MFPEDELEAIAHYLTAHSLAGHRLELVVTKQVYSGAVHLQLQQLKEKFVRDDELYDRALDFLNARAVAR